MMLPEDELQILAILCSTQKPMTLQDIMKQEDTLTDNEVSAVLLRMLEEKLVQKMDTLSYVPAYTITDFAKDKILEHFLEKARSMRDQFSPWEIGREIMLDCIESAQTPEEKRKEIQEFEKMVEILEKWEKKRQGSQK